VYTDQGLSDADAAWIFIVLPIALVLWILNAWWAYHVAPRDRSWTFCWLTLALGPIGVAAAAVAQPRDARTYGAAREACCSGAAAVYMPKMWRGKRHSGI
jgi:hypothetical protein